MAANQPNAILRGGPEEILDDLERIRHVDDFEQQVKIPHGRCYEHYQPTAERVERDGTELRVFSWTHRTYVAE
ncbi:DUF5988 family protein [Amycolatopsis anabasis]|uniref:DUF5988 family protein n=1 Tax=Amycolatopsis anabasis TaxID=1840409 RepID=UPI00131C488E|nr:DUF5988 family protein [Amycolatopsis anabasis]